MTRASWAYYVRQEPCRAVDYYLGHDQDDGLWLGRGLEALGLEPGSVVSEKQLEALFGRAINPETGLQLGRTWRADGVTGYDLTFSTPKSVSALTALLEGGRDAESGTLGRVRGMEGPALPGEGGGSSKPQRSQSMQSMLTEDALDVQREQGRVEAHVRTLLGLHDVAHMPGSGRAGDSSTPRDRTTAGEVGRAEVRRVVVAAHNTATRTALTYLDTHASLSRRGTDGVEQVETAGLTVAAFTHYTSREGDPQLHTHALVLNKVQCSDGIWRTLDGHEMFAHKKSAGMIYQAVLRNELAASLEIAFQEVSKDGQAEILGIPERLLEQWSKRTHNVNAEAAAAIAELEAKHSRTLTRDERAAVTKTAVLKTRPDKSHEPAAASAARWQAEAQALGIDLEDLLPAAQRAALATSAAGPSSQLRGPASEHDLAMAALTAAGRGRAVFGRAEVAGHVAALLPTTGMPAAEVLATVERVADQALGLADAVPVGASPLGATHRVSDARYATVEVLQAEARILTLATRGRRSGAGQVGFDQVRETLAATRAGGVGLDRSQVEAVLHLTNRGDTLSVLTAPAGAGKTATLGTCAAAWHAAGYRVIGLAPSARAAAELGTAISAGSGAPGGGGGGHGPRTDTLAKWLHTRANLPNLDSTCPHTAGRGDWTRLDARTVLVVDEASMASTLDLDTLTTAAATAGAKVVLVGDPAQIGVINGPGGMLATLANDGHAAALTAIHRFSQDWEKQASLALRSGDRDALEPYLTRQRLHPRADGDAAADALFAHWQHANSQGVDALMLARTRVDVDALNIRARAAAQALGHVTGPAVMLGGRAWQAGDLLRTRKNNRQLLVGNADTAGHVRNGDRWRVLNTSPDGGLVVEDLTGRGRTVLPAQYVAKHCEYGWAATIDGSQGATCDVGLLLARPGLDREHLYVAMTRGRHANHAYLTPDSALQPDQHTPVWAGPPRAEAELQRDCLQMLQTALAVSGAQDSATSALRRHQGAESRRQPAAPDTGREHAGIPSPHRPTKPRPAVPQPRESDAQQRLVAAQAALGQLEQQRRELRATQDQLWTRRRDLNTELAGLPRLAVIRRHTLTAELTALDEQQPQVAASVVSLDKALDAGRDEVQRLARELQREQDEVELAAGRAAHGDLTDRLRAGDKAKDPAGATTGPGAVPDVRRTRRGLPATDRLGLGLPDELTHPDPVRRDPYRHNGPDRGPGGLER